MRECELHGLSGLEGQSCQLAGVDAIGEPQQTRGREIGIIKGIHRRILI